MSPNLIFSDCCKSINELLLAARSQTDGLDNCCSTRIVLRLFIVRQRKMISVVQTDESGQPVLGFLFLVCKDGSHAFSVSMYQKIDGFCFRLHGWPDMTKQMQIALHFCHWHQLATLLPVQIL